MTRFVRKTISKHAKILSDPTLNIKQCRETLDELSNDAVPLAKEDVTSIAKALKHFADDCFIPIEYAHELLKSCGRLMDQDETENNLKIFTENTEFFLVLYHIVEDFANVANPSGESSLVPIMKNTSFINYQCYQAAIFLLLGMVDKSSTLMLFTKNIKKEYQRQLLIKLGSIILRDLSYVSQEVALDIICRVLHFYEKKDQKFFKNTAKTLPNTISCSILDESIGPINILKDMRDILNEVNEDNDSIHSVKLSAISYKMKDSKEKVLLQEDVWLDLSSDEMTILLTEHDVLLKIYYQAIHRFHFATKSNSAQVLLDNCDCGLYDAVNEADKVQTRKVLPVLDLEFGSSKHEITRIKEIIEKRLTSAETIECESQARKTSVVSSKEVSPAFMKTVVDSIDMEEVPKRKLTQIDTLLTFNRAPNTLQDNSVKSPSSVSSPDMEIKKPRKLKSSSVVSKKSKLQGKKIGMASKDVDSLITAVDKSFAPTTKDATLKEVRQNNCKQSVSLKKVTPKATKAQGKTFCSKLKESVIPFKKTELHTTQPSKFGLGSLANRLEISIPSLSSVNTAAKARMRTPSTLGSKEEVVTVRSPPSIARDTFEELTIPTDSPQNVSSTAISAVTKPMATIGFKRKFATKFNNTASIKKPLKDESVHSSTAAVTAKVDKRSTDLAALAPVPKSKQKSGSRKPLSIITHQHLNKESNKQTKTMLLNEYAAELVLTSKENVAQLESTKSIKTVATVNNAKSPELSEKVMEADSEIYNFENTQEQNDEVRTETSSEDYCPKDAIQSELMIDSYPANVHLPIKPTYCWRESEQNVGATVEKEMLVELPRSQFQEKEAEANYTQESICDFTFPEPVTPPQILHNISKNLPKENDDSASSSDENGVVAMLLEELVNMQKIRVQRKREKQMMGAVDTAVQQVDHYLHLWKDLNEKRNSDLEKSLTTKAAIICTEIDNLCDNIGTDTDHYKAEVSLSKTIFSKLEKEVQKYKSEVHTMTGSYREEESLLRSDAMKVLDSLLDSLKQNTMKKAKPQTHKRDSKTLLMALRNL